MREQAGLQALIRFELQVSPLAIFDGAVKGEEQGGILFSLTDDIQLVNVSGRVLRKTSAAPFQLPSLLQRLEIDDLAWLENAAEFEKYCSAGFARPRPKTPAAA